MSMTRTRNNMSLFWRMNIYITMLLLLVIALSEFVLEPLAEVYLASISKEFLPQYEVALWAVSIVFPSLLCSYILSKVLSDKCNKMAKVAKSIAHGNLSARLPVTGNDKDAFDVFAQSFNYMAEGIERQMENERRLLADISHELRSPLARMTIAAELLPRREGKEERANIFLRLNKELLHMNELVSLLLSQAKERFLSGDATHTVKLKEILEELADDFTFQGEVDNKGVETVLQDELTLMGNPLLLRRMFSNLLANAIYYSPPNKKVVLAAVSVDNRIIVTIRDYGPGVPEEQLKDIFRAFFRVDNSRARTSGGAGLGLALVQEDAIAHKGSVEAENAKPGLLVTVNLPIKERGVE